MTMFSISVTGADSQEANIAAGEAIITAARSIISPPADASPESITMSTANAATDCLIAAFLAIDTTNAPHVMHGIGLALGCFLGQMEGAIAEALMGHIQAGMAQGVEKAELMQTPEPAAGPN